MKDKVTHVDFPNNKTVQKARHYIQMVGAGDMLGFTLIGPPGMGKTHLIRQVLDEMSVPYEIYGGHITLAGLYEYLYEHCDKVIFFDDVSQIVSREEQMELIKQALNQSGHERILNYRSKGNVLAAGIKNRFTFTGRMIFAFNAMDSHNPNVKAIVDRAPKVELKFSRKEVFEMMYKIAKSAGGGLQEHEKTIVTKEIESSTDVTMDVSFRGQQIAFKNYIFCKRVYGLGNNQWKEQVRSLFGKRKRSEVHELLKDMVGDAFMPRLEFATTYAITKNCSLRTAQRRIQEGIEMEEIYQNKLKFGDVSIKDWKKKP